MKFNPNCRSRRLIYFHVCQLGRHSFAVILVSLVLILVCPLIPEYVGATESSKPIKNLPAVIPQSCGDQLAIVDEGPPLFALGALHSSLFRLDGFGTTYLSENKIPDHVLSVEEIKFFKQLGGGGSRSHHFQFSDLDLEMVSSGVEPVGRKVKGTRHFYIFRRQISNDIEVIARLAEDTIGAKSEARVLVGLARRSARDEMLVKLVLGSTGRGSVGILDKSNVEHFVGHRHGFSTYKFITLHVPEENKAGSRKWVPTGSASVSVEFLMSPEGDRLRATISGYAVKR